MEAKEKTRLARLTTILTELQSKRLLTAPELAKKHGVSVRTIYRDIRTLEESGIPIFTEEGKGYSLVDGFNLPPVMFSEEEANALITAEQLVLKNKDESFIKHYKSATTKIKSILRYSQKDKAQLLAQRILFRHNLENQRTSDHLIAVQTAITNFQLMELEYLSLKDEKSSRTVEPFALYSTQDNWLLIAFCRKRNDFRSFRLDRIENLKALDEKFEAHQMTLLEYLEICRQKFSTTSDTPDTPLS